MVSCIQRYKVDHRPYAHVLNTKLVANEILSKINILERHKHLSPLTHRSKIATKQHYRNKSSFTVTISPDQLPTRNNHLQLRHLQLQSLLGTLLNITRCVRSSRFLEELLPQNLNNNICRLICEFFKDLNCFLPY